MSNSPLRPTNEYEFTGFMLFQKEIVIYLVAELVKTLPKQEQVHWKQHLRQRCEQHAKDCADHNTTFVVEKLATKDPNPLNAKVGIANGLEKGRNHFLSIIDDMLAER